MIFELKRFISVSQNKTKNIFSKNHLLAISERNRIGGFCHISEVRISSTSETSNDEISFSVHCVAIIRYHGRSATTWAKNGWFGLGVRPTHGTANFVWKVINIIHCSKAIRNFFDSDSLWSIISTLKYLENLMIKLGSL